MYLDTKLETKIVEYFTSDKFANPPYLSCKNISKNIDVQKKYVVRVMTRSTKFNKVPPNFVGSLRHIKNINIFKYCN